MSTAAIASHAMVSEITSAIAVWNSGGSPGLARVAIASHMGDQGHRFDGDAAKNGATPIRR